MARREGGKNHNSGSGSGERQWKPWLVPVVLVANIAVFVAAMFVKNCPSHPTPFGSCVPGFFNRMSFQSLRENPLLGPSSNMLVKLGALERNKVVDGDQGWRLVS